MGNLMTGSSNYQVLEGKYGNFGVPAYRIKVNGMDLVNQMDLLITELIITLSLNAAGSAVFKIGGVYDEKSHSFQANVKSKFKPGTVVSVELGYLSSCVSVFKGYVAMVGAEFEGIPLFVVTLMDARRLMMCGGRKQILHNVKNYSDAVRTVLKSYAKLCTANIDTTSDSLISPVSQTTTDYDFITKELMSQGRVNREFFIVADQAYFRKPHKIASPMLTVQYGRELLELVVDFSYLDLTVEVLGYNAKNQTGVKGSSKAKGYLSQSKIMGQTPGFTAVDPGADSQAKAKISAETLAREMTDQTCQGRGCVIGLPEIVPGRYLKVESLESMMNHSYYITEVVHEVNSDGFTTHFEIGGVK